ncbi:MAG TPA: TIR domain-containing protein [Thermoanaerobaculia bacterium]|nr:TIR domain-containing protein [Thermoanaerobaculia bacterium]
MTKPTVFISYSHQDKRWKDKLVKHLGVLEQEGLLVPWDDRRIETGTDWLPAIEKAMSRARVAVLLVSAEFLTSKFIRQKEVPRLLERREKEGMRVIPVIARSCNWPKVGWLASIQAALGGKPLASLRGNKIDEALTALAAEIFEGLEQGDGGSAEESFLATYRRCLSATYSHWDLAHAGVAQSGGAGASIEAKLDDMYLPLRLGEGFDLKKTDRGGPVSPTDLLARERPLVIRGAAGSGKTTWIRWTFRRLLEMDEAFPLMLVLRDLARRWQDPQCKGAARSLETFLQEWIAGLLGSGLEGELKKHLAAEEGSRPALLIDGWDETGPLGKELREKLLVLMKHYPRLQVVVTSRPYGEARPSHGEGFDLLDIQPLSDGEIGQLTHRFFTRCYGQDEATATKEVERFQLALSRAPEPQALARTALLLTMMLLISRSRPLPDKRHLLYEVCIENLLTALPQKREEEGALLQREQWRPEDSEERLRVVAALAFGVQAEGYKKRSRAAIVQTWEEMAELLSGDWSKAQRSGFLGWLAGPAGLLTDRADGTLVFTHLSFQEFLTACHLNATVEGAEARVEEFQSRLADTNWWETLRLWAALIGGKNPARLDPILEALTGRESGLSLAGTMLADGLGADGHVGSWVHAFLRELALDWPSRYRLCFTAWGGSRQETRKQGLSEILRNRATETQWLGWYRFRRFAEEAGLGPDLPLPERRLSHAIVSQIEGSPTFNSSHVAAGRILCGGSPLWPIEPEPTGLLQVWPSFRRIVCNRLQLAVSCGASLSEIRELGGILLRETQSARGKKRKHDSARGLARYLARDLARDLAGDLAGDLARYLALDLDLDLARNWARDWALYLARIWARDLARDWARDLDLDLARGLARNATRDWAHDLVRNWARDLARTTSIENSIWLPDFSRADFVSLGRIWARAQLAHMQTQSKSKQMELLSQACELSFRPNSNSKRFEKNLRSHAPALDPLWSALSRHLARRSTAEDRALLIDLAQYPEHREPPLSWGLQYIVRGDVMFEDGFVVTLDEFANELGLPSLPYLEEMPDELEIDWGKPYA